MMKLIEKMTTNTAKLYNLKSGSIEEGKIDDLVIFERNEKFITDEIVSKSSNSPFKNSNLYGKVKYTICSGKVVFEKLK